MNPEWKETTIDGPRTRRWSVDARQCAELAGHHIAWLGMDTVHAPYRRVRLAPSGSFFLACLDGEGCVFLEGRWQRVTAGQLCLAPPRVLNAFHAVPGKSWSFAWIRYEESPAVKPLVGADSPLRLGAGIHLIFWLATALGWVVFVFVAACAVDALRARQWLLPAVVLYTFALCLSWPHATARYLVPLAPLILLMIVRGSAILQSSVVRRWQRLTRHSWTGSMPIGRSPSASGFPISAFAA